MIAEFNIQTEVVVTDISMARETVPTQHALHQPTYYSITCKMLCMSANNSLQLTCTVEGGESLPLATLGILTPVGTIKMKHSHE